MTLPSAQPDLRKIAEKIVDEMFVNGMDQHAERLVLTSVDGVNLGGWGKGPLQDIITRNLSALLAASGGSREEMVSHSMRKRLVAQGAVGGERCGCNAASWCDAHRPEIFGGKSLSGRTPRDA